MQENHRNGQDDSDVSEPFTITRAALNRQIISSGSLTTQTKVFWRICVEQNAWIHFIDYTRPVRYSINMQWECGQTTSPLLFSFVSLCLFLFQISRKLRKKWY